MTFFEPPDERKPRCCATLFPFASGGAAPFWTVLDRFIAGQADARALTLLK